MPSFNTREVPLRHVTLYLGSPNMDNVVAPDIGNAAGKDTISVLMEYVRRIANTHKSLDLKKYPLVFVTDSGWKNFDRLRKKFTLPEDDQNPMRVKTWGGRKSAEKGPAMSSVRQALRKVSSYNINDFKSWEEQMSAQKDDIVISFVRHALRTVHANHINDFDFTSQDRIYIAGNGRPGEDLLEVDGREFTMKEVVDKLVAARVPKDIRDIRLTSAHSASVEIAPSLKDGSALKNYGMKMKQASPSQLLRIFNVGGTVIKSAAEHLANRLAERGFSKATVTGYHGYIVPNTQGSISCNARRNPRQLGDFQFNDADTVRRSRASLRFSTIVRPFHDN